MPELPSCRQAMARVHRAVARRLGEDSMIILVKIAVAALLAILIATVIVEVIERWVGRK